MKERGMTRRPGGAGGAEQGNALVLAVLILMSLTAVGLIGVQQTNTELLVAGNVSRSAQAHAASEAGVIHAMKLVGDRPQQFLTDIQIQRARQLLAAQGGPSADGTSYCIGDGGKLQLSRNVVCRSSALGPDNTIADQQFLVIEPENHYNRVRQDMAYQAEILHVHEVKGAPGYDVDADICQQVFDFNARGGIPSGLQSVEETLCPDPKDETVTCAKDTVVVQNRVRAVVGPVKCVHP